MKKFVFLLCLCTIGYTLYSQTLHSKSVYTLDLKKDIALSALALGLFSYPVFVMDNNYHLPDNLDKNDVNAFDRKFMFEYNNNLVILRHVTLPLLHLSAVMVPFSLVEWKIKPAEDFNTWFTYGTMYLQTALLAYGTRVAISKTVERNRPAYYYDSELILHITGGGKVPPGHVVANSFPSASTVFAFLPATFLSVTFSTEYPDSRWKIPVIVGSHAFATGIGAIRVLSGRHFLTDCLAGAAIGSFYGWLVPTLHKKTNDRVSLYFTSDGCILSLKI